MSKYMRYLSSLALLLTVVGMTQWALASECALDVYGNANLDDSIDERDIAYVEGIIDKTEKLTYLSDANNDGVIDQKDIKQISDIIAGDAKQLTVLDELNRTVTLKIPINRVVVTEDKLGEVLQVLDVDDKVVGIDPNIGDLEGLFPVMEDKTPVGNCGKGELDYEAIASLEPDLVIVHAKYLSCSECVDPLESIGIPVIALDNFFGSTSGVEHVNGKDLDLTNDPQNKCFRVLGMIFNKDSRAKEFLDWRNDLLENIKRRTDDLGDDEIKKALLGTMSVGAPMKSIGEGRKDVIPLEMAGLECVDKVPGSHEIDPEFVITSNPQYIFITGWSSYTGDYTVESNENFEEIISIVRSLAMFEGTDAVKNGDIYVVSGESDIRIWIGAAFMGKVAYPDRFEDIDPDNVAKDYFENWMGVPYKGMFFYPKNW